ncbi:acetylhydrolase [Reticulibacter mediterranei]|uniref:Acetylhydrolase n=1 Tax=Reticulibacter mediterranei TaxID=2778369 RepID=A0A8J3IDG9_9CHLR|nr:alpha/beta hydrolase [Reticulibacter mediterranei]GHO90553.1 acetylhydrolase [Reticulibacter mediterranei]
MPLDPQAQALLTAAAGAPPLNTLSPAAARQFMRESLIPLGGEPEPVHMVEDREVSGPQGTIPVRIYTPEGQGPFPVLIFFHGGGWVIGDLDTHDAICRSLTRSAGCVTVSVDYRLAPEHKYPAARDDCYAATKWVAENARSFNGDPERLAVGGDSAGGGLAAVVTLMARDQGGPHLAYQFLIYPVTDYYKPGTPSYQENAEGYFLTRDDMIWFWDHYMSSEEARHPYASPLRAESLHSLPPAMVITAEFDPLRDEGEQYATRLRETGISVVSIRYPGQMHLFMNMAGAIDQGKRALADVSTGLRFAFRF